MVNRFKFDYKTFEVELRKHARQAFIELRSQNDSDTIYGYGLESHMEFEPLYPFVITNKSSNWNWQTCSLPERNYDLDDILSKLHHIIYKGMGSLDGMAYSARDEGYTPEQIGSLIEPEHSLYRQACINALQDLDRAGFFGKGKEREVAHVFIVFTGNGERILIPPVS